MARLLYVHSGGVNKPERSATPIDLATSAAAMDIEPDGRFASREWLVEGGGCAGRG